MRSKENKLEKEEKNNIKKGRNKGEIRKDNKGRMLYEGESQIADGKYLYQYQDKFKKRKRVTSWKLTPSDKLPEGKRECKSLRELEQEIKKDLDDSIGMMSLKKPTLNDRFESYIKANENLAPSTRNNYIYMYNLHIREDIGKMQIYDINFSTLEKFYMDLISKKGFAPNSVEVIHGILNPIFERAVNDDLIRKNNCNYIMESIRKSRQWKDYQKEKNKKTLSVNQQKAFIDFIKRDKKYKKYVPVIITLIGAGLNIRECIALTWDDINFDENVIQVRHKMLYRSWDGGKCCARIFNLESKNEERDVPMIIQVREVLLGEHDRQSKEGFSNVEIDGYSKWCFTNSINSFYHPKSVNEVLYKIVENYNEEEMKVAEKENRKPQLLPDISCTVLRNTFCKRLAESGIPLQAAQKIMGHSNVHTTMSIYESVEEDKQKEFIKTFAGTNFLE